MKTCVHTNYLGSLFLLLINVGCVMCIYYLILDICCLLTGAKQKTGALDGKVWERQGCETAWVRCAQSLQSQGSGEATGTYQSGLCPFHVWITALVCVHPMSSVTYCPC